MTTITGNVEISLDIDKIEIEPVWADAGEDSDEVLPSYSRSIRLTTDAGQIIDLSCRAIEADQLVLVEVALLPPIDVAAAKLAEKERNHQRSWLEPKRAAHRGEEES